MKSPPGFLAALYLTGAIAARFFPLVGDLHYEFAAVMALLASLLTGTALIFRPRPAPEVLLLRQRGVPAAILWMNILQAVLLSLIPLAVALVASIFGPHCGLGEGITWYLLLVPPAAAISAILGALAETITRRRWLAIILFLLIWLGSIARGAYEALTGPHIFMYAWQVGFFPGGSWDAELPVTTLLVVYRAAHLLLAGLLALVIAELSRMARGQECRPRMPLLVVTAAVAFAAAMLIPARSNLGLTRTDRWLQAALGDSLHTRFATIYYHAATADSVDLWRAANLTDFYIVEHARALGIPEKNVAPVTLYLFASASEEKKMVGTASAAFTKPWARKLSMSFGGVGSTLRHELAHVMLEPFGNPLGISISQGMLEGSAEALENDYLWRTLHQYAHALYYYNLAPPADQIMSIGGFSSRRSSVSYVLAGSFSKWLMERYGMPRYLKAFAWGDFDGAYGRSLHQLAGEYRTFLDTVKTSLIPPAADTRAIAMNRVTMQHLFGGGSFFFQECLRRIGTLNAAGFGAIGERRYDAALEQFRESLGEGINYGARIGIIQSLSGLGRYRELLDSTAAYALDTASYPLLPYLIEQGDARWALGDTAEARRLYDSVARLDINRDLTLRAVLRLYFLDAPDTLRTTMRNYFIHPLTPIARAALLSQAIDEAPAAEEKMLLTLIRATLTINQAPRLTLSGIVPAMMRPPFQTLATGTDKLWAARNERETYLITALVVKLDDAAIYTLTLDPKGPISAPAMFILKLGTEIPYLPGAEQYLEQRREENTRFYGKFEG